MKNRNGIDGVVYPIFMDPANVDIKVLPQIHIAPDDEKMTGIQNQYKKWRDAEQQKKERGE